jgi:hypothetical protein
LYFSDGSREPVGESETLQTIQRWAAEKSVDVVIWTLANNFREKSKFKKPFSVANALSHILALDDQGKVRAAEYVWRAPSFIDTPLRNALQVQPWFPKKRG